MSIKTATNIYSKNFSYDDSYFPKLSKEELVSDYIDRWNDLYKRKKFPYVNILGSDTKTKYLFKSTKNMSSDCGLLVSINGDNYIPATCAMLNKFISNSDECLAYTKHILADIYENKISRMEQDRFYHGRYGGNYHSPEEIFLSKELFGLENGLVMNSPWTHNYRDTVKQYERDKHDALINSNWIPYISIEDKANKIAKVRTSLVPTGYGYIHYTSINNDKIQPVLDVSKNGNPIIKVKTQSANGILNRSILADTFKINVIKLSNTEQNDKIRISNKTGELVDRGKLAETILQIPEEVSEDNACELPEIL